MKNILKSVVAITACVFIGLLAANTLTYADNWQFSVFGEGSFGSFPQNDSTQTHTFSLAGPTSATPTPPKPQPTPLPTRTPAAVKKLAVLGSSSNSNSSNGSFVKVKSKVHRRTHAVGGGGIEGTYFFNQQFGIAIGAAALGNEDTFAETTVNVIYRLPWSIGYRSMASAVQPYLLVGAFGDFGPHGSIGGGQAGGGFEFRFDKRASLFVDGRYSIHDARDQFASVRSGLRFDF